MLETNLASDSLGRSIEIKKLTAADQFDLLEAAQNLASYEQWYGLAALVFSCVSIDGVPLPAPRKPSDFKKNAVILKDEGLAAISAWLEAGSVEATQAEITVETAKN